jgi:hypothetical protein
MESWGLPHCVRISTGTDEDLDLLFEALEQVRPKILSPAK